MLDISPAGRYQTRRQPRHNKKSKAPQLKPSRCHPRRSPPRTYSDLPVKYQASINGSHRPSPPRDSDSSPIGWPCCPRPADCGRRRMLAHTVVARMGRDAYQSHGHQVLLGEACPVESLRHPGEFNTCVFLHLLERANPSRVDAAGGYIRTHAPLPRRLRSAVEKCPPRSERLVNRADIAPLNADGARK